MRLVTSNTRCAVVLLVAVGTASALVRAQTQQDRTQDKVAFPAHTIIGNLHYVGTATLNSYLFTTPQGHILINTNYEDTVPLLRAMPPPSFTSREAHDDDAVGWNVANSGDQPAGRCR